VGEPGQRAVQCRVGVVAGRAAVDSAGDAAEVVRLVVTTWCGEREQDAGGGRYAAESGTGGGEDESADPVGCLVGELLGISMFPPMPISSSRGSPVPWTATRRRTPSTST
jgi:hypothetical protein